MTHRPTPIACALLLAAALALGCASQSPAAPAPATAAPQARVTPDEARALVQSGARLVDVRTPEEFSAGHMEGALNVPVDALQGRALAELAPKDAPVVVYCRSGKRSARAKALLEEQGFTRVHDLGPMPAAETRD